jgi:hypothetical protein
MGTMVLAVVNNVWVGFVVVLPHFPWNNAPYGASRNQRRLVFHKLHMSLSEYRCHGDFIPDLFFGELEITRYLCLALLDLISPCLYPPRSPQKKHPHYLLHDQNTGIPCMAAD